MRIQLDLDPKDVWRIQAVAASSGRTPGQVIRDELARKRDAVTTRAQIRVLVLAGKCDADIAAELHMTNGAVAAIRRGEHLPANRRYARRTA